MTQPFGSFPGVGLPGGHSVAKADSPLLFLRLTRVLRKIIRETWPKFCICLLGLGIKLRGIGICSVQRCAIQLPTRDSCVDDHLGVGNSDGGRNFAGARIGMVSNRPLTGWNASRLRYVQNVFRRRYLGLLLHDLHILTCIHALMCASAAQLGTDPVVREAASIHSDENGLRWKRGRRTSRRGASQTSIVMQRLPCEWTLSVLKDFLLLVSCSNPKRWTWFLFDRREEHMINGGCAAR